ncbi:MAG: hypothetical protein RLY57_165 [Candidatus Parcubacteria bacterium]|jgi:glycine/D-amino acid oxidase-like deaminating enzyme
MTNRSPWLHELKRDREPVLLDQDVNTDVVVVGAGIAGISTCFFLLTQTAKSVVLVDRSKVAHGATGHNAGYLATYFERPFADMVKEFGLEATGDAHRAVESAWELLDLMYTTAGLNIPLARFEGHMGVTTKDQVLLNLENNWYRKEAKLKTERIQIADHVVFAQEIPDKYKELFTFVPHEEILKTLETENSSYIASFSYQKGTANSALLSEGIYTYLAATYGTRFKLYEHTDIQKVVLRDNGALLDAGFYTINAQRVILCTNGFEHIKIFNQGNLEIDKVFHKDVSGVVGYMSAYLETMNKPPLAVSYFGEKGIDYDDDYFYLSRRQYEYDGKPQNLISIGGPVKNLEDRKKYIEDYEYPEDAKEVIDTFVKDTYDKDPNKKIEYQFTWHGLMGYTPNKIRLIGPHPRNPVLMYNLGCNGLGLLPSIYGGKRIVDYLSGAEILPMIFDPK